MMTDAQIVTFKDNIAANTDPVIVANRSPNATRNDSIVRDWYNTASTTDAWMNAMRRVDLWNAMNPTQYDGITQASKRELWLAMMEIADAQPFDMGRSNNRNTVSDIWASLNASQKTALFTNMVQKALRVELVFPAPIEAHESVNAVDRSFIGKCTDNDVGRALNLLNG